MPWIVEGSSFAAKAQEQKGEEGFPVVEKTTCYRGDIERGSVWGQLSQANH